MSAGRNGSSVPALFTTVIRQGSGRCSISSITLTSSIASATASAIGLGSILISCRTMSSLSPGAGGSTVGGRIESTFAPCRRPPGGIGIVWTRSASIKKSLPRRRPLSSTAQSCFTLSWRIKRVASDTFGEVSKRRSSRRPSGVCPVNSSHSGAPATPRCTRFSFRTSGAAGNREPASPHHRIKPRAPPRMSANMPQPFIESKCADCCFPTGAGRLF